MQSIDTLVGENKTVATINSTLRDFCNNLPGELKDTVRTPTVLVCFFIITVTCRERLALLLQMPYVLLTVSYLLVFFLRLE